MDYVSDRRGLAQVASVRTSAVPRTIHGPTNSVIKVLRLTVSAVPSVSPPVIVTIGSTGAATHTAVVPNQGRMRARGHAHPKGEHRRGHCDDAGCHADERRPCKKPSFLLVDSEKCTNRDREEECCDSQKRQRSEPCGHDDPVVRVRAVHAQHTEAANRHACRRWIPAMPVGVTRSGFRTPALTAEIVTDAGTDEVCSASGESDALFFPGGWCVGPAVGVGAGGNFVRWNVA